MRLNSPFGTLDMNLHYTRAWWNHRWAGIRMLNSSAQLRRFSLSVSPYMMLWRGIARNSHQYYNPWTFDNTGTYLAVYHSEPCYTQSKHGFDEFESLAQMSWLFRRLSIHSSQSIAEHHGSLREEENQFQNTKGKAQPIWRLSYRLLFIQQFFLHENVRFYLCLCWGRGQETVLRMKTFSLWSND